jgi:hypothetical protein
MAAVSSRLSPTPLSNKKKSRIWMLNVMMPIRVFKTDMKPAKISTGDI